ncbi:CsbD family protein [Dankookia sp. GCM10030260]|uniref:CsbD family protein n=1 Tax=Dankookia sp. GCM10030260 TaxID=3273390 RepID=UPI0036112CC0
MNSENLEGAARGIVGKAQESFGEVTGDAGHRAEGVARQVAGRAQEAYGDVKQAADQAAHQVGRAVKDQPVVSLLVAGVIGYALGLLTMGTLGGGSRHRYW